MVVSLHIFHTYPVLGSVHKKHKAYFEAPLYIQVYKIFYLDLSYKLNPLTEVVCTHILKKPTKKHKQNNQTYASPNPVLQSLLFLT